METSLNTKCIYRRSLKTWTLEHLYNHPLNFIDIIFSAPHLSITLTNSSTEIKSSWKDHQPWSTCTISSNYWLTSDLSISSMNLSAILSISFLSRPSTIIVRTATSSFLIENSYWYLIWFKYVLILWGKST